MKLKEAVPHLKTGDFVKFEDGLVLLTLEDVKEDNWDAMVHEAGSGKVPSDLYELEDKDVVVVRADGSIFKLAEGV